MFVITSTDFRRVKTHVHRCSGSASRDDWDDSFQSHWWRGPGTRSRWKAKGAGRRSWGSPGTATGSSTSQAASHHHRTALNSLRKSNERTEDVWWTNPEQNLGDFLSYDWPSPVMGLWLLLPGLQLSLTLRSWGSDSSRSVGGSGRSTPTNRWTIEKPNMPCGSWNAAYFMGHTHHH